MELYVIRKEVCDALFSKSKDEEIQFGSHAQFECLKSMFTHISNKFSDGYQKHLIQDLHVFFAKFKTKYLSSEIKYEHFLMKEEVWLGNPQFEKIELKEMHTILPDAVTGRQEKLFQDKKEVAQTSNPRDLSTISMLLHTDRSFAKRRKALDFCLFFNFDVKKFLILFKINGVLYAYLFHKKIDFCRIDK